MEIIKKPMQNLKEKEKGTIHAILAGLLLNGFIQGETREKLDDKPLDFAKKEFDKFLDKVRKETRKDEREKILKIIDEVIGYGDTVEGGVAEGVLILIKSKIIKELK